MGLYGIILSRGIIDLLNAVLIFSYVRLTDIGKAILKTKITLKDIKKNMKVYYSDLLPAAGSTYLEFAVYQLYFLIVSELNNTVALDAWIIV